MSDPYRLTNWVVKFTPTDPFTPPECVEQRVSGDVYGHPRHKNGERVFISRPVSRVGDIITTISGSRYVLGEPAADYLAKFPDAKARLLKSIPSAPASAERGSR